MVGRYEALSADMCPLIEGQVTCQTSPGASVRQMPALTTGVKSARNDHQISIGSTVNQPVGLIDASGPVTG